MCDGIALPVENRQRLVHERPGLRRDAVALDGGLAQSSQRECLDHELVLVARLFSDLGHLELDGAPVLESPRGPGRHVPRTERGS